MSFFIHYTFFSEKMEKSNFTFKYIIQIVSKKQTVLEKKATKKPYITC
ncbi:hypothetical protein HMPREF9184_00397 [Streptococcus sp. oral taxon 058 str. F0407]|nr:hypothetical protein HMPREF9184_00397 [Streptococcus sp. oral taxon 058 str. F0407]